MRNVPRWRIALPGDWTRDNQRSKLRSWMEDAPIDVLEFSSWNMALNGNCYVVKGYEYDPLFLEGII